MTWPPDVVIALAAVVPLGWIAMRVRRNPALGRRLGGAIFVIILFTLLLTIAQGQFMRFAPGYWPG